MSLNWRSTTSAPLSAGELLERAIEAWTLAGSPPRPEAMAAPGDRYAGLLARMSGSPERPHSRASLAREAGMHPAALDRAFRETYGASPMRLLRGIRIGRARELLAATDLTLETIAERAGFARGSYFARAFRAATGLTPGEYRRRSRGGL